MSILEAINLEYCYDDGTKALNKINISIKEQTTTAILGGNGSGKTTLFLTLNGILKPTTGQIVFDTNEIAYDKKSLFNLRQNVGIVFQNSDEQLFSSSVKKDIAFGLLNMGLSQQEVESRIDFVVKKTGIENLLNKPTHALSFGQKKRVAIAGVLAMQPKVIILDEPTAGLDPKGVSEILDLIEALKKEHKLTIIIATHDIDLIPLYCQDVYVLDKGNVVFHGSVTELCENTCMLRNHNLRLPRIAHLMEILHDKDNLNVDKNAATISEARKTIKQLVGENK